MFDIDSKGKIIIKPEMLMLDFFKVIYDSHKMEHALKVFAFIYFRYDLKSPYKRSYDDSEIEDKVISDIFRNETWVPDEQVREAGKKYEELQNVKSLATLRAAENALAQITQYFNDFNINDIALDKRHLAVNNMMKNLEELDEVIDKISSARKRVESELLNKSIAGKRKLGKREMPKEKD